MERGEPDVGFLARERPRDDALVEYVRSELTEARTSSTERVTDKFVAAALSAVPWLGSIVAAGLALKSEGEALRRDDLLRVWLEEHQGRLRRLNEAIAAILKRFESLGDLIHERIQDEEYLALVRRTFRVWDRADTDQKRRYAENIIVNAAGTRVCSDDVVRLLIDFLDTLHEMHLRVIHELYNNSGITRYDIWLRIYGNSLPAENSAEADLFALVIRDLSTGSIIRQARETTPQGDFIAKPRGRPAPRGSIRTLDSRFDDKDPYELTALGAQFVHYAMNEVVARIEGPHQSEENDRGGV